MNFYELEENLIGKLIIGRDDRDKANVDEYKNIDKLGIKFSELLETVFTENSKSKKTLDEAIEHLIYYDNLKDTNNATITSIMLPIKFEIDGSSFSKLFIEKRGNEEYISSKYIHRFDLY